MKAVVLSAKKKDSLFPYTETRPTGLLPVGGGPLIEGTVSRLLSAGAEEVYIVTSYMEEMFIDRYGERTDVNTVHQEELSGTASAVLSCSFIEEDFMVVNGDVWISEEDLEALMEKHGNVESGATVLGTHENRAEKFGVLSIQDDKIAGIEEKPEDAETSLVNTGIYCFSPSVFDVLEEGHGLTEAVMQMEEPRFEVAGGSWIDIGRNSKILEADREAREVVEGGEEPELPGEALVDADSTVKEGAEIEPGAAVKEGSVVCEGATVGAGAVVRDSTICSDAVVEGTVEDSLVMEGCEVEPETGLRHSAIGEDSTVGSGSVVRESFIGPDSKIGINNSMRGVKTVPGARTDLGEISK